MHAHAVCSWHSGVYDRWDAHCTAMPMSPEAAPYQSGHDAGSSTHGAVAGLTEHALFSK